MNNRKYEKKRSFWHWLFSIFTGYIEHRKYPGWSGFLPFYRTRCPKHGPYITYPHGYNEKLLCPKCREELLKKRETKNDIPDFICPPEKVKP